MSLWHPLPTARRTKGTRATTGAGDRGKVGSEGPHATPQGRAGPRTTNGARSPEEPTEGTGHRGQGWAAGRRAAVASPAGRPARRPWQPEGWSDALRRTGACGQHNRPPCTTCAGPDRVLPLPSLVHTRTRCCSIGGAATLPLRDDEAPGALWAILDNAISLRSFLAAMMTLS